MTTDRPGSAFDPIVPAESFTALLRAHGKEPRWSLPGEAGALDAPEATTVLAFRYADGVLMAGDRRATAGNVIAYRTMQKVFPADAYSAVGISGTAGTCYRIERRTSLSSGNWEPVSTNLISVGGVNPLLPRPSGTNSTTFSRAVWLP